MKRYRLPLLLGVGFFVLGQVISALLNIWTSRIPADTPYLEYTPHLLLAAIVVGVGVFAWQYRAERRAEADGVPLPATPRGLMIAKVRAMWIAGVLERSLYRAVQLVPGLRSDLARVDLLVRKVVQEAGGEAEDLAEGTRIADVSDRFGGALLILGAPGAGKTTLLLELARELLDRAETDATLPIPVVFPLSTWAAERKPLHAWLIDQLRVLYQVSKKQATAWVEQHQILPLLDGLDEVAEAHRPACVRAINTFREERGTLPLVVCSRLREYETVAQETAQLRLHGAVIVQTLRQAAVLEALAGLGPEVQALRDALAADQRDWLWKVATSPLGLSVLIPAVQHSPTLLQAGGSDDERRDRIFGAYVDAMFARRAMLGKWLRKDTIYFLSWLAVQMQERNQTLMLIEGLQPDWLPQRRLQHVVRWSSAAIGVIIGGLLSGSTNGLISGLAGGLIGAIAGGILDVFRNTIEPVERLEWSWKDFWRAVRVSMGSGFVAGVIYGLIFGPKDTLTGMILISTASGLAFGVGISSGTGLFQGLKIQNVGISQQANQGIIGSARSALIGGLLFGPGMILLTSLVMRLFGVLLNQQTKGLIDLLHEIQFQAIFFGLLIGLIYGGRAVIKHYTLRLLLAHAGLAPLRYADFLDHAADRVLLRRVGGGWVFVHRELLDYFAGLAPGLGVPLPAPAKEKTRAEGEAAS